MTRANILYLVSRFFLLAKQKGLFAACSKVINYLLPNRNFKASSHTKKAFLEKIGPSDTPNAPASQEHNAVASQTLLDFEHQPLISVLVVSYNSRKELIQLFTSLKRQTYRNFEVILVENGDQDNSILLHDAFKDCKYIDSDNIGFAAANNLAFENSRGSYVFLANPDIVLADDVLLNLIDQFRIDPLIGAAIPKIYFSHRFVDIEIKADRNFSINIESIINTLSYKKYFIRHGLANEFIVNSLDNTVVLSLPLDESKIEFRIDRLKEEHSWSVNIKGVAAKNKTAIKSISSKDAFSLQLSSSEFIGRWIINNASSEFQNQMPFDRGFGSYDYHNEYSSPEYVGAFCGAAVLLDPKILFRRKIFVDQFFAYFEDSELSTFITKIGYKIKYLPNAIVWHDHSQSTSEGSVTWSTLVNRGRFIYQYMCLDEPLQTPLYSQQFNFQLAEKLQSLDAELLNIEKCDLIKKPKKIVGVYNSYWNTFGGGERHALSLASWLSEDYDVVLISENDFDDETLIKYFGFSFNYRKLVSPNIDSAFTSMFDVFVNSTYSSNLVSHAKSSLYIVSFPHKLVTEEFLSSYLFLHNSDYTFDWAKKYWGDHSSHVLYPTLFLGKFLNQKHNKRKTLITIGRFSPFGHSKRHDVIINAFKNAKRKTKDVDYKLIVCGSLNEDDPHQKAYFSKLSRLCCNDEYISLSPNISFDELQRVLSESCAYLHATGVGTNVNLHPEKLEHFGITVVEAALCKTYPIVYSEGGPAASVRAMKFGSTFASKNELEDIITDIFIGNIELNPPNQPALYFEEHNFGVLKQLIEYLD